MKSIIITPKLIMRMNVYVTRETAQWLSVLTVLREDLSLFPAPTSEGSQLPVTTVLGDLMPSSGLLGYLYSRAQAHAHTYNFKIYFKIFLKIILNIQQSTCPFKHLKMI